MKNKNQTNLNIAQDSNLNNKNFNSNRNQNNFQLLNFLQKNKNYVNKKPPIFRKFQEDSQDENFRQGTKISFLY